MSRRWDSSQIWCFIFNANHLNIDLASVNATHCIGAAIQIGGVVTQATMSNYQSNGAAVATMAGMVDDRYACLFYDVSNRQTITLSAFDAQGFTVTTGTEAASYSYGYMAFAFHGKKIPFLQVINSPTAPSPR